MLLVNKINRGFTCIVIAISLFTAKLFMIKRLMEVHVRLLKILAKAARLEFLTFYFFYRPAQKLV